MKRYLRTIGRLLIAWFVVTIFFALLYSLYDKHHKSHMSQFLHKNTKRASKSDNCWQKYKAKVTAYVPKSEDYGKYNDGKTALGDNAFKLDGVAVAPKAIPYRSKVYIPSVGVREADDTGSAMRRAWKRGKLHIDLRVKDLEEAKQWGVKHLTVFVKKKTDK